MQTMSILNRPVWLATLFAGLVAVFVFIAPRALAQTPISGNYGLGAGLGQTSAIQCPSSDKFRFFMQPLWCTL